MAVGIALVGAGKIGSAVAEMLLTQGAHLRRRSGQTLELRHVVEKYPDRIRDVKIPQRLLRSTIDAPLKDAQTQVVIELIGGLEPARTFVLQALKAGKHVVTANKYLLAIHGQEIFAAAKRAKRCVSFEASCGGAIPIVLALTKGLLANDIERLVGIVNGTCNYILSQMSRYGQSYADALAGAQAAGFAEADPTLDVNGTDSAHKITILAGLAFGAEIPFSAVDIAGIDTLQDADLNYGKELGYVCKLLAIAEKSDRGVSLRVHPTFVAMDQPLASVHGSFNAISVFGHAAGQTLYYGRGAGPKPTASAVLADVIDVAMGTAPLLFSQLPLLTRRTTPTIIPTKEILSRNYLRFTALDLPGVMARVTTILGDHGISISAVVQHESKAGQYVPVVVMTHEATDGAIAAAVAKIDQLKSIRGDTVRIRVLDSAS